MSRPFLLALAGIAAACAACSSSPGNGASAGSGGSRATTSAHGTTTITSGTGGGSSSGTGSTGGADAGAACSDPSNPMLTSCIVPFLAGCWAPDLSGTCTDTSGVVSWSDGFRYVSQGAMAGLYAPGSTTPCITMSVAADTITGTKGSETLVYAFDTATKTATITCPDMSTFTATSAQVTAFNICHGLNCP
jgi:hypothetical protein